MECENGAVYFAMVETEVMLPCSEGSELCGSYIKNCGCLLFCFCMAKACKLPKCPTVKD